ncbi:hypothetical protein LAUMK41_04499 [Mycobacterium attenuatum]|nr:hypothetical protein LAUMK41_04499 [Mycobacterium attenuatum]
MNHIRPVMLVVEAWDRPMKSDDEGHLVVVCSYDCDFVNPRDRAGVLLAPVMKMPASPGSPREAEILASDVIRDGKMGYANLFPLVLPAESEKRLAVVDFSSMATLASVEAALAVLTAGCIFTMTPTMRLAFKQKLALFFTDPETIDA